MIAVDTNTVIRLLTRDDEAQYQAAYALFSQLDIYIPKTVILETEWVLRFAYEFAVEEILAAIQELLGLENVEVEDPAQISTALDWSGRGLDFADAMHLAACQEADSFVTFDRRLTAGATGFSEISVKQP